LVHGDIGAAEQGPGVAGVLGAAGDANAGPDAQRLTVDHERALDGAHQALGHRHSHGGSSAGEEDGELVAAEARKGIPVAQLLTQVRTHFAQEQVPDVVPEGVVDLLEPVEVHEEQGDAGAVTAGEVERVLDAVVEQDAVRETRERVVKREPLRVPERGLGRAPRSPERIREEHDERREAVDERDLDGDVGHRGAVRRARRDREERGEPDPDSGGTALEQEGLQDEHDRDAMREGEGICDRAADGEHDEGGVQAPRAPRG